MGNLPHDREAMRPRPTVYRGTLMRSTLEARAAQILDSIPDVSWEYEPARYMDSTGGWLPDLVVRGLPCPLFIEVKGPPLADEARGTMLRSMMRVWDSVSAAGLAIWSARTLDGEPFDLIRRGSPIVALVIRRCDACGCGWFVNLAQTARRGCPSCAAAAA